MNGGINTLIIIGFFLLVANLSGMKGKRSYGGGKSFIGGAKRNFGVMGLVIILLSSLAFNNCLALQGA